MVHPQVEWQRSRARNNTGLAQLSFAHLEGDGAVDFSLARYAVNQ
jgi:hypothetical protein